MCVGRPQDTSELLAKGRPDNLDTTSTTNRYSISKHRLGAAIQRLSPPQLRSHSASVQDTQLVTVTNPLDTSSHIHQESFTFNSDFSYILYNQDANQSEIPVHKVSDITLIS